MIENIIDILGHLYYSRDGLPFVPTQAGHDN